jgi:hypothetical protein
MMILKTSRSNLSSNDQLSLDLPFAATKSLAARVGPTPTFTRASSATFVGSNGLIQSAATNTPRFDHTAAGVCRGLLIEEGRTNLSTYSEDFSLAFTTERASIDPNITTAPDGATTADKLVEDTTATNSHRLTRQLNLSAIPYTFSVFAKASERSWIRMTLFDGVTSRQVWFNVSAGTIGTQSGATGQIASFGNGWWRCSITATGSAFAFSQANIALSTADNIGVYTGDGTSGLFLWGAQVEAGSFPTSYIPTTTGTLARSADVCSISGANFTSFYNQSEGTLFADVFGLMTDVLGGNRGFAVIADGTYNNSIGIYKAANAAFIKAEGTTGNVAQFVLNNAYAQFTQYKVALGVKTNDTNAAFNGSLKTTDTSVTLPSTMNKLEFRDPTGAAGGQPSCHLAAIRYYRKRLPNAKLQALTA